RNKFIFLQYFKLIFL
uniref:Uncharacterized protein n=1 Tax=Strongyloides stercoralis TaxID=6248 RepID=A0A0K0EK79_STRER